MTTIVLAGQPSHHALRVPTVLRVRIIMDTAIRFLSSVRITVRFLPHVGIMCAAVLFSGQY